MQKATLQKVYFARSYHSDRYKGSSRILLASYSIHKKDHQRSIDIKIDKQSLFFYGTRTKERRLKEKLAGLSILMMIFIVLQNERFLRLYYSFQQVL